MKRVFALGLLAGAGLLLLGAATAAPRFALPPSLPAFPTNGKGLGNFLTPEQGKAVLDLTLAQTPDLATWQARSEHSKLMIQRGAGLEPWPKRSALNPIIREAREHDGYTIANVAFESLPGVYATGNLYRPLHATGPTPAIIYAHGHGVANQPDQHPRFSESAQDCCATLARMGATVFAIDMFGWGDTQQQVPYEAHLTQLAAPMQIWNAMRAIDFLSQLDGVDPKRIAMTGASGGGTQTFVVTALDSRVAVSVPVVMVSSYFFGGCACESGRPIHHSDEHFITNAEIAALAAPRPMLVVSDGADWTQHVPEIEYPFLQKIYALTGSPNNVANVHLPTEKHDYGPSKRAAAYKFLSERLGLNYSAELVDEKHVTVEVAKTMRVFDDAHPIPAGAVKGADAVAAALETAQKK